MLDAAMGPMLEVPRSQGKCLSKTPAKAAPTGPATGISKSISANGLR